jgi:hypothetical protein
VWTEGLLPCTQQSDIVLHPGHTALKRSFWWHSPTIRVLSSGFLPKNMYYLVLHSPASASSLTLYHVFWCCVEYCWPPLWSSAQSCWLQIQRSRVRFPALPDFLTSSGSVTGPLKPREYNWGATWKKSSEFGLEIREYGYGDVLRSPHNTLCPHKLAPT